MTAQTETSPACSECGTQLLLVRIFPDTPRYEQRTYECPWCPHEKTAIVRSIPSARVATTCHNEKVASPPRDEPVRIQMIQLTMSNSA